MLRNLWAIVIFLAMREACCQNDWGIAVAVQKRIELLHSNGTQVGVTVKDFHDLKALAHDFRDHFIVIDRKSQNDDILSVRVTKETETTHIRNNLTDDVQGLAVDSFENVLYWTNMNDKMIKYLKLNDSQEEKPGILFDFNEVEVSAQPRGIAIDVCRRYIYWTNRDIRHPTIERAFLNGSNREILIESDLKQPTGVAVDYVGRRLYWADLREGIFFRIESSDLDGKERETFCEDTHTKPFSVAVDEFYVYWTDDINHAIWRMSKTYKSSSIPEKIRDFEVTPWGILSKPAGQLQSYSDCEHLKTTEQYVGSLKEVEEPTTERHESGECMNGGTMSGGVCTCKRGYIGHYCEIEDCHNFCVQGSCHLSPRGYAQCRCPAGFKGNRCEIDLCLAYCLNGGSCKITASGQPQCVCPENHAGERCEIGVSFKGLCQLYCQESPRSEVQDYLLSKDEEFVCRCKDGSFTITENNFTTPSLYSEASPFYGRTFLDRVTSDSTYAALIFTVAVLVILNVAFVLYHCVSKRKRPRVTKRMVVTRNLTPRNVTPLTYRPTTEQCEVTIENCCNMNVCETPCFEPPSFLNKNREDKKVLLSDMESGEESSY